MKRDLLSLFVAGLATLFFVVAVPMQTYIANASLFNYGPLAISLQLAFLSALVFVAISFVLTFLRRYLGKWPALFCLAFVVYEYLEAGILSMGMPSLNGELDFFLNGMRRFVDTSIALIILLIVCVLHRFIAVWIKFIALALAVMFVAFIFDGHEILADQESGDWGGVFSNGMVPKRAVLDASFFSANRNMLVFILDSVANDAAEDVLSHDSDLSDAFIGFARYTNDVAMHPNTTLGVPGLLTGEYYDGSSGIGDYSRLSFSETSCLYPFVESKVPLFVQLGCFHKFGYTNQNAKRATAAASSETFALPLRRIEGLQAWNLFEIVCFRLSPFAIKGSVLARIMNSWDANKAIDAEEMVFQELAKKEVRDGVSQTLHVIHTEGAHAPYTVDRQGNKCANQPNYNGAFEKTYYVLKSLASLFEAFKKNGVYDNSMIIVCSDHGNSDPKSATWTMTNGVQSVNALNRAFPILWIKPIKAHSPTHKLSVAVTHANLNKVIRASLIDNLNESETTSMLESAGNRLYRDAISDQDDFCDWIISSSRVVDRKLTPRTVDPSLLRPVLIGRVYSMALNDGGAGLGYPPVVFTGVEDGGNFFPIFVGPDMEMYFRVLDKTKEYTATMTLTFRYISERMHPLADDPGKTSELILEDTKTSMKHCDFKEISVHNLKADTNGVIRLDGHIEGPPSEVLFKSFVVREMNAK